MTAGEVAEGVRVALGGEVVSEFWEGQRNYGIQVRQAEAFRTDIAQIATLPLMSATGQLVPLEQVARIEQGSGPSIIRRENVVRRIAVEASVEGRDLGSTVRELQTRIAAQVKLPEQLLHQFRRAVRTAGARIRGTGRGHRARRRHSCSCCS